MSTPVRARRLTEDEGRYLLRLVRRGVHDSVRYRRALIIMASSSGTRVPVIARLVAADPDTVRDVIHAFNERGLAMLPPRWGPGRPRRITDADIEIVVAVAKTRPARLGLPFTHWSIRKLAGYLDGDYGHQNPAWMPDRTILGGRAQSRAVPDPDQRLVGGSDRGPVRAATHVHHGQLELPQPHRLGPSTARLPALA